MILLGDGLSGVSDKLITGILGFLSSIKSENSVLIQRSVTGVSRSINGGLFFLLYKYGVELKLWVIPMLRLVRGVSSESLLNKTLEQDRVVFFLLALLLRTLGSSLSLLSLAERAVVLLGLISLKESLVVWCA